MTPLHFWSRFSQTFLDFLPGCLRQETVEKGGELQQEFCFGLIAGTWLPPSIPSSSIIGPVHSSGPEHPAAAGCDLCRGLESLVEKTK